MPDNFFWYDVMTTDTKSAAKFYAEVVGWGVQDSGVPGTDYTLFTVNGQGVAGLMSIPQAAKDARPAWMGYIMVDDVDAMAKKIVAAGGALHREPCDVPGVLRFAVVADPQGGVFLIAKPFPQDKPPTPLAVGTPGTCGWRELYAENWESVWPFYEKLFGWTKAEAIDMGPLGQYQLFAAGAEPVGGMITKPPQIPRTFWGYYMNVPSVQAAVDRIKAAGGQVLHGPAEVPGGQWIVQATDPQGAYFALVSVGK